jgi:hypothetical protein
MNVITKCNMMLNPLKALKTSVQSTHLERMYTSFILPHLEYGSTRQVKTYLPNLIEYTTERR